VDTAVRFTHAVSVFQQLSAVQGCGWLEAANILNGRSGLVAEKEKGDCQSRFRLYIDKSTPQNALHTPRFTGKFPKQVKWTATH
jgi:hypothetical protein